MGDFDRAAAAGGPKDQTKQIIIMIVLAVVLFGYLGMKYLRPSPASGQPVNPADDAAVAGPAASIEDIQKIGKVDPTRGLLENNAPDHSFDKLPHDPFALSPDLKSRLIIVKAPAPGPQTQRVHVDPTPGPTTAKVVHYEVDTSRFHVDAVIKTGGQFSAILNGHTVFNGSLMEKEGVVVLEVLEDGVILRLANDPEGIPTKLAKK